MSENEAIANIIIVLILVIIPFIFLIWMRVKEKREWQRYKKMRWDNSIMGSIEREMEEADKLRNKTK